MQLRYLRNESSALWANPQVGFARSNAAQARVVPGAAFQPIGVASRLPDCRAGVAEFLKPAAKQSAAHDSRGRGE